jgi:NAD(P)-dependent dehydrogenase (short-subunit alcohol dehydrogenase family)
MIGSVVGLKGNIGQTIYSASKAGLIGFTKSLAKEVAPFGITANLIAPGINNSINLFNKYFFYQIKGFVKTDMTSKILEPKHEDLIPLKRIGFPEEVADAVFFLANATYITGEVLLCDGGLHLNL